MARKMKDSGVEWIGEIPEEWEIRKLDSIAELITDYVASGSFASLNENVQYLDEPDYAMLVRTVDLSGLQNKKHVYINQHAYEFLRNSNLFGGEIILSNIGSVGNVYIYEPIYKRASLAPNAIMVNMRESNGYYYYWFISPLVNNALKQIGSNAVQCKFNKTQLRAFLVAHPPQNEQKQIADFLDEKVGEIDSVIVKTRETIEDYKKYKQAIINKNIEDENGFKYKFRYLGELKNGLNYHSTIEKESIKFLGVSNFKDFMILNKRENFSDLPLENELPSDYLLKNGDIIFVRSNGSKDLVGRSVMVDNVDYSLTYSGFCIRFRNEHIELVGNKYLLYFFRSESFKQLLYIGSNGMAINNLSQDILNSVKISIPSVKRQEEIVAYLDKKCSEIDKLITKKEELLADLESYKKSLIYEYVTGKKEVE